MELPAGDYTVPQAEKILGLPYKRLYVLVREGRVKSYRDCTGKIRVPVGEVYAILRERERGAAMDS